MIAKKFRVLFRPRDLFLHDGVALRRFRLGTAAQLGGLMAALLFLACSVGAGLSLANRPDAEAEMAAMQRRMTAMDAEYASLKRAAQEKAAALEQRQQLLASVVAADTDLAKGEVEAELSGLSPRSAALLHPLAAAEARQRALAGEVRELADRRLDDTRAMLRRLGLEPKRLAAGERAAMGGPFEPVSKTESDPEFRSLFLSWKKLGQLEQGVIAVPSQKPVASASFTSGFGVRSDPFNGGRAMHAGIDLAGPTGTPIYAAADGIVDRAEWASGYGNLIEIEHGKGIQTRYGHLSQILVRAGQRVKRGDLIARMGSTGRSTGSHLHYEVRLDGRPVNPIPFLQSSDYLLAVQRRAEATQIALGGPED